MFAERGSGARVPHTHRVQWTSHMSHSQAAQHAGGGVRGVLRAGCDWFLSPAMREAGDSDTLYRARLVVGVAGFLAVSGVLYCLVLLTSGSPTSAMILAACIGLSLFGPFLLRSTDSPAIAANIMCLAVWMGLTGMACRLGGNGSAVLSWYAVVPVTAMLTAGRRSALAWLLVTLFSLLAFYLADYYGWTFPNDLSPKRYALLAMLAWGGIIFLMLGLSDMADAFNRQTVEELADTHGELQHVMDATSQVSIIATDPDGLITHFNRGAEYMLGYKAEEMVGITTPWDLHLPSEIDAYREQLRETLGRSISDRDLLIGLSAPRSDAPREWTYIRKDGSPLTVTLSVSLVHNDRGDPASFVGVALDITERKSAEEELRRLATAAQQTVDGMAVASLDGSMLFANDAWAIMHGFEAGNELTGHHFSTFHTEQQLCRDVVPFNEIVLAEGSNSGEVGHVRRDGSTFPSLMTVTLLRDEHGVPYALAASARDITKQKEAERELVDTNRKIVRALHREKTVSMELEAALEQLEAAMREAEAATRSKSEFLANMSHEIRTPMTAILGFADNLVDPRLTDAEKGHAVQTIRRNGEHLMQIINDILDISKVEAGKLRVERMQFSPIQLIAEVKSLMETRASGQGLSFGVEFIGPIPETIHSDPTRLRQILVNLISNAIKFTESGGVRVVMRLLQENRQRSALQFDVIDTGIGMSRDLVGRLFEPFTQADTSAARQFGGTGLGLTISKRLAQLLGGDISIFTESGEGSTFRVTIDTGSLANVKLIDRPSLAEHLPIQDCARPSLREQTEPCRILLVEDGPDNQRLIEHILKRAGADVTVADNGKIAVDLITSAVDDPHTSGTQDFDIILMDMQMPVMDGYEATYVLRKQGYDKPIIALTAHAMAGDREKCLDAGCDDFATKPIDRNALVAAIDRWLGQTSIHVPGHNAVCAAGVASDAS